MIKITTLFVRGDEGYTTSMSFFVTATEAEQPKSKNVQIAGVVLAALLTIMLVGQLFTYEKFAEVIQGFGFFSGSDITSIIAALIVTFELAALPFLLRMRLSPLARIVSMVVGWTVLLFWLGISFWLNITLSLSPNSGVLGDTIKLPVGWWMVTFFVALSVLDLWVSYGVWPAKSTPRK
jgi:hypothetical protein